MYLEKLLADLMHTILKKSTEFDAADKDIEKKNELISAMCLAPQEHIVPKKPIVLIGQLLDVEETQTQSQKEPRWTHESLENNEEFHKLNRQYNAYIDFLDQVYKQITTMRSQQIQILRQQIDRINSINIEWGVGSGIRNTVSIHKKIINQVKRMQLK